MQEIPIDIMPRAGIDEREVTIDFHRLIGMMRKNRAKCGVIGVISFFSTLILCAILIPQSFTSQISLSFPQSPQPSALSLLAGTGAGSGSRYVGVLRSRRFAEQVASAARVGEACGIHTHDDAVEAVVKGVSVNDNAKDSLIYLSVSLPGPPRLAVGASERRERIKKAVSVAANAYAGVLRTYLQTSDTDREAILLRAATDQLSHAHDDYQQAVRRLGDLVVRAPKQMVATGSAEELSSNSGVEGRQAPTTRTSVTSGAMQELQSHQLEQGRLVAEIQAERTTQSAGQGLRQGQLQSLESLPGEDPLLATARAEVYSSRTTYGNLTVQFGPDYPDVIRAREQLRRAEANLHRQVGALRRSQTSEDVGHQVRLRALLARLAVVNGQVAVAQKKAFAGLVYSQRFQQRSNDVALRLEVLKATASQAALMSLQSVSLKNRMAVVDAARPAKSGSPGLALFSFISIFVAAAALSLYLIRLGLTGSSDGDAPAIIVSDPTAVVGEHEIVPLVESTTDRH